MEVQIVEQILPFFQPDYTLTINDMADMGIKRDVPIILNDVSYEDSYQGDFESRRAIVYTLGFTTKFYLYGSTNASSSVIKTVQVDQYANLPEVSPTREQRYSVTPKPSVQMMTLVSMRQVPSLWMQRTLTQRLAQIS